MKMTIRKAAGDDYDALCQLFEEVDALHRYHLPHIFQKPDGASRERDYFFSLLTDESTVLFVAETDGKITGFAHAVIKDAPALPILTPRRYAVLEGIAVRSGLQNQGIGMALMQSVQEWGHSMGAASIELNVYEFNQKAIAFYEKLGYETYSRKMSKKAADDGQAAG